MIVIFMVITTIFHLTTLQWIINKTLSAGIIAIVIIFQPELRRALEELGKKNVFFKLFKLGNNLEGERLVTRQSKKLQEQLSKWQR